MADFDIDRPNSLCYELSMTTDAEFRTPGQLISWLLEQRGWSQRVLAIVLNADVTGINKIVGDKRPVTAELALALSELFGVEAERFLELQKSYDLAKARIEARPDPGRATRAHLFGELPVSEMIQRGWITADGVRDVSTVEAELARFFGVDSPDQIEILPHSAKKTQVFAPATPPQLAWLYRVRQIAARMVVPKYNKSAAQTALVRLSKLRSAAEEASDVPRILTECGIRFVIVETLPGANIDGVCTWLDRQSPVIGLSMRHDRIDNFWFVLRHELEHVIQRHGGGAAMLDAELEGERAGSGPSIAEEDSVANQAAAEFCAPTKRINSFIARKAPLFRERDILSLAKILQVHPGLVVGQLHHRTQRYELLRNHLAKMRHIVAPNAMVDGWGDIAPIL
jgi:HTH-type transcriptional regulator/antitoxin HigA